MIEYFLISRVDAEYILMLQMYIVGISSISATLDKHIVFYRFEKMFQGQGT